MESYLSQPTFLPVYQNQTNWFLIALFLHVLLTGMAVEKIT